MGAVSPVIELKRCAEEIRRWEARIYEIYFLHYLKTRLRHKQQLFPDLYPVERLEQVRCIWDFDDLIAPYTGFREALDYYTRASALPYLTCIRVPTLIIHAQNDPLISFAPFTDPALTHNPYLLLVAPKYDGYVAFWGQRSDEDPHWAENRAFGKSPGGQKGTQAKLSSLSVLYPCAAI